MQVSLLADGAQHEAFRVQLPAPFPLSEESPGRVAMRLVPTDNIQAVIGVVRAPVNPGHFVFHLRWGFRRLAVPVTFVFDPNDSYGDGTPDFLRLHDAQDRQAFRNWFTSLAEAQLAAAKLPVEIDDCAALLRFAYREALHIHDERWMELHPSAILMPSIHQYAYPQTPLAANLFRVRPGSFVSADLGDGAFAQFADARTLMQSNAFLVGRDLRVARPGDLIFYRQLDEAASYDGPGTATIHSPFHSMILCGKESRWVVYHTGPIHHGKGEMRRLAVSDLMHYPDARWRPVRENANFLGVYRWNILREED